MQTAALVWDKGNPSILGREFKKTHELILHAWGAQVPVASGVGGWSDVLRHKRPVKKVHVSEKPVDLLCELMAACGDVVMDPFMGSGSTAVAAYKSRKRFVGVEIDRHWFDVAVERINRMTADGPLFEQPAPAQMLMAV